MKAKRIIGIILSIICFITIITLMAYDSGLIVLLKMLGTTVLVVGLICVCVWLTIDDPNPNTK